VALRDGVADDESVIVRPILSALRRRLAHDERGISLIELLTSMAIMLIVISTLAGVFVSGSNAEIDLRNRFEAQSNARLALDKFRREVHNACLAAPSGAAGSRYTSVTLTFEQPTTPFACSIQTTWCAVGTAAPIQLYRKAGATCDGTGVKWADYLTTNELFAVTAASAGTLPKVGINLSVDTKPSDTKRRYHLQDDIAIRNYQRANS
jgi:Tfp pilus assembly protein PilW